MSRAPASEGKTAIGQERETFMKPGFLSYDSKFIYVLNKIVDIIIADLLWLLCSIPLVTVGASTSALYYVTVKVVRRDRSKVFREFFRSFRMNLLYGVLSTLLFAAAGLLVSFYIRYLQAVDSGSFAGILYFFSMILSLLLYSITLSFYFPVLSRFQMKFWSLLKLSFFIAIRNIGRSLLLAILIAGGAFLISLNFGFLVLIPSLISLIGSFLIEPVLQKYMPRDAVGADDWYFEDETRQNDSNNADNSQ